MNIASVLHQYIGCDTSVWGEDVEDVIHFKSQAGRTNAAWKNVYIVFRMYKMLNSIIGIMPLLFVWVQLGRKS